MLFSQLNYLQVILDISNHNALNELSEDIMPFEDDILKELYTILCYMNFDEIHQRSMTFNDNLGYYLLRIDDIVHFVFYNILPNNIEFKEHIMFSKQYIINKVIEMLLENRMDIFPEHVFESQEIAYINNIKNCVFNNLDCLTIFKNKFMVRYNNDIYILDIKPEHKPNLVKLN